MNQKHAMWLSVLAVAVIVLIVTCRLDNVFGQQGGAGGAGASGRGGAGGVGGVAGGGRGGAGGVGGGFFAGTPGSVSATADFVYVVHHDTLYQFGAHDLSLVNQVSLEPPPQKTPASGAKR